MTAAELASHANVLELLAKELGVPAGRLKSVLQASSKMTPMDTVAADPHSVIMTTTDERPTREQFAHLAGVGITLSEAAKKYETPRHRIHNWAVERGYVKCVDNSHPAKYDEADIAFCVALVRYRESIGIIKTELFNEDGTPRYELLDPRLSWRRRKHAHKNNSK